MGPINPCPDVSIPPGIEGFYDLAQELCVSIATTDSPSWSENSFKYKYRAMTCDQPARFNSIWAPLKTRVATGKIEDEPSVLGKALGAVAYLALGLVTMASCENPSSDDHHSENSQTNRGENEIYSAPLINIRDKLKNHRDYLESALPALANPPNFSLRMNDEQARITVIQGEEMIVTLVVPYDSDQDPANGRIMLTDRFVIDTSSLTVKSIDRSWHVSPEVEGEELHILQGDVDRLNTQTAPSLASAHNFIIPILYENYFNQLRAWAGAFDHRE